MLGKGRDACLVQPVSLLALCSAVAGGWESMGWNALRPNAARWLRRAALGRRRRRLALGPDPRAVTRSRFLAASTGRTHLFPAASTGASLL